MRRSFVPAVLAVALVACASQPAARPEPVTVFTNAKIFTSDRANLWAEAIAVQGERIVAVGASSDVLAAAQQRSTVIDVHNLEGRVVVPGFNDAHFHSGVFPESVAIKVASRDPEAAEVLAAISAAAKLNPAGTWLSATGSGRIFADGGIDRAALDAISTDHAIVVANWSGHGRILNSHALRLLGFTDADRNPRGGSFGRAADGRLNGRLDEYAGYAAARRFAELAPEQERIESYAEDVRTFAGYGVTSVQDFALINGAPATTAYLARAAVPLRWRVIRFPLTDAGSYGIEADLGALPPSSHPGAKWIVDGTPIERGGAMLAPYADAPTQGRLNFTSAEIAELLVAADRGGEQPMLHAFGDGAIEAVLDALDATGGAKRWSQKRVRIEHGDMSTAEQIARMRELGVIVVQNPSHFTIPEMMYARYGRERSDPIQPLASLLRAGVPLAIGSDGPPNPFLNIMFATTHPTTPSEALTREEAVIAYTYGSAYAEFAEEEKGTLAVGKLADLAVLDADIFTIPPDQLPRVKSTLTMIGGKVVGPPARRP